MMPPETSILDSERYMDKKVNGMCIRIWKAQRGFGKEGEEIADAQLRGIRERIPPSHLEWETGSDWSPQRF